MIYKSDSLRYTKVPENLYFVKNNNNLYTEKKIEFVKVLKKFCEDSNLENLAKFYEHLYTQGISNSLSINLFCLL